MTKRSDAKAATRALVLKVARACFEELGYEGADIRTMAATMGMSTGAVFSNFTSKAILYREVYGHAPISPEQGRALLEAVERAQRHALNIGIDSGSYFETLEAAIKLAKVA